MDVPTLLRNLKEEVSCSVCTQLYTKPKQPPCLHIFCLECLNNIARTSARQSKIKCPLCQIEVAVPKSGTMETLPSSFYLKNLLDIFAIKECSTSKVTCGNCETETDEASFCFQCGGLWCNSCRVAHNILRSNRSHHVLALKDFKEKDYEVILKRPAFCQKNLHEKEVLSFYCKLCEIPVCQNCVTIEHHQHDVEYLEATAQAAKFSVAAQFEAAEKEKQNLSESLRELEEKSRGIDQRSQFLKRQIRDTVQSLILRIRQQEQDLITEVQKEEKIEQERVTKDKAKIRDHLNKIEDAMSRARQAKHFIDFSTAAELVRAKSFVNKLLIELPAPELNPFTCERDFFQTVFLENKTISRSLQNGGIGCLDKTTTRANRCTVEGFSKATAGLETHFKLITRNADGNQSYSPGDHVVVEIASIKDGTIAGEVKILDKSNGRYEVSCIPKRDGEHIITARVNGEQFVHVKRSYKLARIAAVSAPISSKNTRPARHEEESTGIPTGIPTGIFRPRPLLCLREKPEQEEEEVAGAVLNGPWGVTVNDKNQIIVCNYWNHRIHVFSENGDLVRTIEHKLLAGPTGICTDSAGTIYVAAGNKILLFNSNGHFLKEIIVGKNQDVDLKGITLDEQGNIIVTNRKDYTKAVHILSPEGKLLKKIGRDNFDPWDCSYYDRNIFVSNWATQTIDDFDCEGKFLKAIGTRGTTGSGKFHLPTGLAIDKTRLFLVTDVDRVQVFTLDGIFVSAFGNDVLSSPRAVSVLKDGRVVVTDCEKDQVLIFGS